MTTTTKQFDFDPSEILAPDGYAMRVIRYRAACLVHQKGVPAQEQEDVEQELSFRLLKRLRNYDPARSKLTTFISSSVRYDSQDVLRERYADKHIKQRATRSLDVEVGMRGGQRLTLGDFMTRSQQVRGRGRTAQDDQHQVDLHEDVQGVMDSLPPDLKKACAKLLAARSSAAGRRAVPTKVLAAIRHHFEQAGLRDYL